MWFVFFSSSFFICFLFSCFILCSSSYWFPWPSPSLWGLVEVANIMVWVFHITTNSSVNSLHWPSDNIASHPLLGVDITTNKSYNRNSIPIVGSSSEWDIDIPNYTIIHSFWKFSEKIPGVFGRAPCTTGPHQSTVWLQEASCDYFKMVLFK